MLFIQAAQSVSVPIDTHIPMWQAITILVAMAGTWAVAMYKINRLIEHDKKHFDHALERAIHQTEEERQRATEMIEMKMKGHEDLDNMQFVNVTKRLDGIESKLDKIFDAVKK